MRRLVLPATIAFLAALSSIGQEGSALLDRVAKNHQEIQSIEITGTLSSPLPDSELTIHIQSDLAVAPPSVVPVKHGPAKPFVTRRSSSVTFTDAKGLKQRAPGNLGPIGIPGSFGGNEKLNQDVKEVTELPRETLNLADGPISCRVLQVDYDHADWQPEERRVRYWIDETRL